MFTALFYICIGIIIGWNLPQPQWARDVQEKVMASLRELGNKSGGRDSH
ncbi:MAG: hypothetical protein U9R74_10630 [Pseudomonadota bacterium]|nr:hypothetical protein [Pseudomonadota bacterium]